MRAVLAFAILLLWLSDAAPEPDYSRYLTDYAPAAGGTASSLIEVESSTGRTDRLAVASLQPHAIPVETFKPDTADASADIDSDALGGTETDMEGAASHAGDPSLSDLCNALYTSAQDNDLPIPFFANLIWQESRLRDDAVSRKGAMGIAQFMPETAAESGLDNPFDPLQAIPASARFLRELRLQFGNLGFVAAAYNAGARRVAEWLEHRGNLPRETRGYVARVTGLPVEAWRRMAVNDDALTFVQHLPCRSLPAFASVEQAQSEQAQLQQAKFEEIKIEEAKAEQAKTGQAKAEQAKREKPAAKTAKTAARPHGGHAAARQRGRGPHEPREARNAAPQHSDKREAERHARSSREKHKSV